MRNGRCVLIRLYRDGDRQTDRHRDAEVGDRHRDAEVGDRHKDAEVGDMKRNNTSYLPIVWNWLTGLFRIVSVDSDFLSSIKKIFNFPNFFHNYLIINALRFNKNLTIL